jgi:ABC-type lipoprotein export system ATPase subunit
LESCSVEQNLALPFSLEIDDLSVAVRASVRRLADEVGIPQAQLPQAVANLDAESQLRVRLGKALALVPRVLLAEHPNLTLSRDDSPRFAADLARIAASRDLATVVMTAEATFAHVAADRVLTLTPATGALTTVSGWRRWLTSSVR